MTPAPNPRIGADKATPRHMRRGRQNVVPTANLKVRAGWNTSRYTFHA